MPTTTGATSRCRTVVVVAVLAVAVLAHGAGLDLPVPGLEGWRALEFPRIGKHTRYTVEDAGSVRAEADCAASALYYPIEVDLGMTPRLQWKWRVEKPLPQRNEREKAGDDFAARVYVMFAFDSERASWWQRLRHRAGVALYGDVIPGAAINYVWSTTEPAGAEWDNPYASESKMVSLGAGPLAEWRWESVDVAADYRKYFGAPPAGLLGVALMTDSDNACQKAVAHYAGVRFSGSE